MPNNGYIWGSSRTTDAVSTDSRLNCLKFIDKDLARLSQ